MLRTRIEQLEKENVLVKSKLETAADSQRAYTASLEQRLTDARNHIAQEEAAHARTGAELANSREHATQLQAKVIYLYSVSSAAATVIHWCEAVVN